MPHSIEAPWWHAYFTHHYGRLYRGPLAEDLPTARELEMLQRLFADSGRPILDIGCGHGRHLAELRRRGVPVVGVDYSMDLMGMMAARHRRHVARGDMRRLPWRDGAFSGAFLMFNSFGYFSGEENAQALGEVARVLAEGGRFVMDAPSRAGMRSVVRELPASMRVQDDAVLTEAWAVDEETRRLEGRGTWEVGGERKEWMLSIRLYTPVELTRLLRRAGFEGSIEIRPLGELELLGDRTPAPAPTDGCWRRATNMAVLAKK